MNRKRVQMLRNMMEGIPDDQVYLQSWYAQEGKPCNTIACLLGWACIYPPFVRSGLKKSPHGFPILDGGGAFWQAGANFFDVSADVFNGRKRGERGTDKQIALCRLDRLLKARIDSAQVTNK